MQAAVPPNDRLATCLPPDAMPASALQTEIEILRQLAM
jgi:hypothetical protein